MATLRFVALLVIQANLLAAQGKNRVEVDLAMQHLANRDAVASPLAYSGVGIAGVAAYSRLAWARDVRFGISVAAPTLTSNLTSGGVPRENAWRVQVDLAALSVDTSVKRHIGPRVSADLAYRGYQPSGVGASDFGYLFAHVAVGAAMQSSVHVRSKVIAYRLGVPLLGIVSRPYTDVRILWREGWGWRFASPLTLQTADFQASMTSATRPNPRWRLVYHGYLALYDRGTPYRAFENSLGLRMTLGHLRGTR